MPQRMQIVRGVKTETVLLNSECRSFFQASSIVIHPSPSREVAPPLSTESRKNNEKDKQIFSTPTFLLHLETMPPKRRASQRVATEPQETITPASLKKRKLAVDHLRLEVEELGLEVERRRLVNKLSLLDEQIKKDNEIAKNKQAQEGIVSCVEAMIAANMAKNASEMAKLESRRVLAQLSCDCYKTDLDWKQCRQTAPVPDEPQPNSPTIDLRPTEGPATDGPTSNDTQADEPHTDAVVAEEEEEEEFMPTHVVPSTVRLEDGEPGDPAKLQPKIHEEPSKKEEETSADECAQNIVDQHPIRRSGLFGSIAAPYFG